MVIFRLYWYFGKSSSVPIKIKIVMVGSVSDVITCVQFRNEFLGVTILQGVEFPTFLLIFACALQQVSATLHCM